MSAMRARVQGGESTSLIGDVLATKEAVLTIGFLLGDAAPTWPFPSASRTLRSARAYL